jgi:hypothetical protein
VYQLRHECYLRKGSIEARTDGLFHDHYDEMPNHFSFLVSSEGEPMATVRISVVRPDLGWTESPAKSVFGDHPALQEMAGQSYVEASRLCFGPQARRDAFVRLLGQKAALAELFNAEWLVACPRVEHTHVYINLFGFRPMANPRKYFGVNFETQLLGIRRCELAEYVKNAKPMVTAWTSAFESLMKVTGPRYDSLRQAAWLTNQAAAVALPAAALFGMQLCH